MSEKDSIKNVAIYFRYSTDEHDQKQNSEKRQLNDIRTFCYRRGYNIVWTGGDVWSKRAQSKNNLKQIGIGFYGHEEMMGALPPGWHL